MAGAAERMRAERRAERAGATRWRGSSGAAAPRWRSNPSPGRSGRSARRWRSLWAALAFGLAEITTPAAADGGARRSPGLGLLALLVLGLRRFRWPSEAAARARIDATLPGRPLAALRDAPALGRDDPGAQAVWAAHLARMRRLAATARPVRGRPAARQPRPLGAAADGAGGADRRRRSSPATAGSSRWRRRWPRRRARRWRPGRASRAGPSRRPIPGGRRSTCRRCRATRRWRCRRAREVTLRVYGEPERFDLGETVSGGAAGGAGRGGAGDRRGGVPGRRRAAR